MPKQKLFDDDSEEEVNIKTENEYAKKYDTWREKEEIHKLEQKYGTKALNSDASVSSDSEDESDGPPEIPEEVEEQFLKTLSLLKTKDPRIYDPSYKFFEEKQKEEVKEDNKKTLTFADSDEDDDDDGNIFSIEKKAVIAEEKPEGKEDGGSDIKKDGKLKAFLTGKVEHIDDPVERDLAPLKALWSDPTLNEGEAFLRDYILNKRYLDPDEGAAEDKLRDDDELEADEKMVEEQGKFERAYNFRFEEPDHEYLKRFPRTMNSIRPKDERRARKRAELRTRKEQEKQRKMEEIARLKALKLKEIQEKIAKIKEVTGNEELAFKEEDIEGDFDPEEHDRRMKAIFDEQYYGEADEEKPVFPDLDEELEIENWDEYEPRAGEGTQDDDDGPHCEDAEFNMDAEYDPKQARANLLQEIQSTLGKKRRNRKKKSKLAKLLATEKPKYIPTEVEKTYAEYMEEYYKMECEDVIAGELPTRFKYRQVVPNDYGLTVEEILLADDKELTQWVPLKKIVRHKPESAQKSEVAAYRQKSQDISLKKKVLPSLFKDLPEEPELVVPKEAAEKQKRKKKKKKNKTKDVDDNVETAEENGATSNENTEQNSETLNEDKKKKRKHKEITNTETVIENNELSADEDREQNSETSKESKKKKRKNLSVGNENATEETSAVNVDNNEAEDTAKRKKKNKSKHNAETSNNEITVTSNGLDNSNTEKQNGDVNKGKKKKKNKGFEVENVLNVTPTQESAAHNNLKRKLIDTGNIQVPNKKKKNKNKPNVQGKNSKDYKNFKNDKFKRNKDGDKSSDNPLSKLSDERLKAYGLNPKKYKNFLKYKKF